MNRCLGKYCASVVDNDDPKKLGRLRLSVPEVLLDTTTGWALPCALFAGPGVGLAAVPPVGATVFVEWPAGDVSRIPIWSGAMWPDGDAIAGAGPEVVLLVTKAGHRLELHDTAGGEKVVLKAASGAALTLDSDGVKVEFGGSKIALTRSSISFNDGALEVS